MQIFISSCIYFLFTVSFSLFFCSCGIVGAKFLFRIDEKLFKSHILILGICLFALPGFYILMLNFEHYLKYFYILYMLFGVICFIYITINYKKFFVLPNIKYLAIFLLSALLVSIVISFLITYDQDNYILTTYGNLDYISWANSADIFSGLIKINNLPNNQPYLQVAKIIHSSSTLLISFTSYLLHIDSIYIIVLVITFLFSWLLYTTIQITIDIFRINFMPALAISSFTTFSVLYNYIFFQFFIAQFLATLCFLNLISSTILDNKNIFYTTLPSFILLVLGYILGYPVFIFAFIIVFLFWNSNKLIYNIIILKKFILPFIISLIIVFPLYIVLPSYFSYVLNNGFSFGLLNLFTLFCFPFFIPLDVSLNSIQYVIFFSIFFYIVYVIKNKCNLSAIYKIIPISILILLYLILFFIIQNINPISYTPFKFATYTILPISFVIWIILYKSLYKNDYQQNKIIYTSFYFTVSLLWMVNFVYYTLSANHISNRNQINVSDIKHNLYHVIDDIPINSNIAIAGLDDPMLICHFLAPLHKIYFIKNGGYLKLTEFNVLPENSYILTRGFNTQYAIQKKVIDNCPVNINQTILLIPVSGFSLSEKTHRWTNSPECILEVSQPIGFTNVRADFNIANVANNNSQLLSTIQLLNYKQEVISEKQLYITLGDNNIYFDNCRDIKYIKLIIPNPSRVGADPRQLGFAFSNAYLTIEPSTPIEEQK